VAKSMSIQALFSLSFTYRYIYPITNILDFAKKDGKERYIFFVPHRIIEIG
jgi:hypothetical protein